MRHIKDIGSLCHAHLRLPSLQPFYDAAGGLCVADRLLKLWMRWLVSAKACAGAAAQSICLKLKAAPSLMPLGQREVTVLVRV